MGSGEVQDDQLHGGKHDACQVSIITACSFNMYVSSYMCVCVFRCVCFSPDGDCLYSGATDCLRVFGWEPDRCFDVVTAGWGKVSDLAICNQQLVRSSAHRLLPSVLKVSSSDACSPSDRRVPAALHCVVLCGGSEEGEEERRIPAPRRHP